jgi:hypothetical protein
MFSLKRWAHTWISYAVVSLTIGLCPVSLSLQYWKAELVQEPPWTPPNLTKANEVQVHFLRHLWNTPHLEAKAVHWPGSSPGNVSWNEYPGAPQNKLSWEAACPSSSTKSRKFSPGSKNRHWRTRLFQYSLCFFQYFYLWVQSNSYENHFSALLSCWKSNKMVKPEKTTNPLNYWVEEYSHVNH